MTTKKQKVKSIESQKRYDRSLILFIFNETIRKRNWTSISRLHVIKIIYLLDKLFLEKTKNKISNYIFVKQRLGPFSVDIVNDLEELKNNGILKNETTYYNYTILGVINKEDIEEIDKKIKGSNLEKEVGAIIDKAKNLSSLLNEVEALKEVKETKFNQVIAGWRKKFFLFNFLEVQGLWNLFSRRKHQRQRH